MDRSDVMGLLAILLYFIGVGSYLWHISEDGRSAGLFEVFDEGLPILMGLGAALILLFGAWGGVSILFFLLFFVVPVLEMLDLVLNGKWIGFFLVLATSIGMVLIWRTL